jgi:hypothetical protein
MRKARRFITFIIYVLAYMKLKSSCGLSLSVLFLSLIDVDYAPSIIAFYVLCFALYICCETACLLDLLALRSIRVCKHTTIRFLDTMGLQRLLQALQKACCLASLLLSYHSHSLLLWSQPLERLRFHTPSGAERQML